METHTHKILKNAAVEYLLSRGCAAVATEVACPISRYRIDVAGYLDDLRAADDGTLDPSRAPTAAPAPRKRGAPREPAVIFIECKATRADFFRDCGATPRLLAERDRLLALLRRVEDEVVKVNEPHLRRSGEFLFPDLEAWDLSATASRAYRSVLRALRRADRQLYSHTKFFMIARYQLASRLILLTPRGMVQPHELPTGWGLLELLETVPGTPQAMREVRPAQRCQPSAARLSRALRNIAAGATRAVYRTTSADDLRGRVR